MTKCNRQEFQPIPETPSLDTLRGVGNAALASLRTEHSRSLDDAERLKAIDMLADLGVVTRLLDMDLYHGRATIGNERWGVDPEFTNGGNDSGNHNVNARPTLYTGTEDVACRFAEMRSFDQPLSEAEVYRVSSLDTDATILRRPGSEFGAIGQYRDAIAALVPDIIRDAEFPFGISSGDIASASGEVRNILGAANGRLISDAECEGMSELARQFAARYNTRMFVLKSPRWLHAVVNKYLEKEQFINNRELGLAYPIDHSFVAQLAQSAHLVGSERRVYSATLKEYIVMVSFFDLYSVDSEANVRCSRRSNRDVLGEFSQAIGSQLGSVQDPLRSAIMNPHATPKAIMEAAGSMSDGYWGRVFSEDAGNWEGYTLGEHTETVLRNLENNFADELPVGALAFARLALIVHDIGKAKAVMAGHKKIQSVYNKQYAGKFLREIGLDDNTAQLISRVVIDSMGLAGRVFVKRDLNAQQELRQLAGQMGAGIHNGARAYLLIAFLLQTCDSGAYTQRARTRRPIGPGGSDVLIQNAASFDGSFKSLPNDLTAQRLEWRI